MSCINIWEDNINILLIVSGVVMLNQQVCVGTILLNWFEGEILRELEGKWQKVNFQKR